MLAVLVLHSSAIASECEFDWPGDPIECETQYRECQLLGPYSEEECFEAFELCSYGVCLTQHPFCERECASWTRSGSNQQ
jgi:hypothetical protein